MVDAQKRFLLLFASLSTFMGVSIGLAKVATSLYAVSLGANESMLGLIGSAQSIGILFMSLPLGFMVERHGPTRVFVTGSVVAGLLYLVIPVWPSALTLLLCTAAISFFMPCRFISLNTVFLSQLARLGEGKAGWYRGSHVAGMFLVGPMLAATSIALLGFAGTFWVVGFAFFASILAAPTVFSFYERAAPRSALTLGDITEQLGAIGRDADLRAACLVELVANGINIFYSFFIVAIAVQTHGAGAAEASSLVVAQGMTFVLGLFTLGTLAARLGQRLAYLISCVTLSVALLLLAFAPSLFALKFGGLVLGAGLGLLQTVNLTRFARIGARLGQGKAAGLSALFGPAGGFLGSALGGSLGQRIGLQTVFLLFVPLLAAMSWRLSASEGRLAVEL